MTSINEEISLSEYFDDFYHIPNEKESHPTQGDIYIPSREEEDCLGIIIISNACDIANFRLVRGSHLKFISYLPIYEGEALVNVSRSKKDKWIKIIKLNHPLLFFLPPKEPVIKGKGALINYQNIRSLKINTFLEMYTRPCLTLRTPYKDRLNSLVSKLYNRIPIKHPEKENSFTNFLGI